MSITARLFETTLSTVAAPGRPITCLDAQVPPIPIDGGLIESDLTYDPDSVNTKAGRVRPGFIWARITATGALTLCRNTVLAADAASAATTITVRNALGFKAGDTIDIGGAQKTISSINYSTNVITLGASVGADKTAGAVVKGRGTMLAGSEFGIGINRTAIDVVSDLTTRTAGDINVQEIIMAQCGFIKSAILSDLAAARDISGHKLQKMFFMGDY